MLFNSYVFVLLFLPLVFAGYWALGRGAGRRAALAWLTLASLVYYGWWSPVYLALIVGSILFNFWLGLHIGAEAGSPRGKRWAVAGLVVNLAALGWFKYANFFLDSVNAVADTGLSLEHIVLPIGISFFTFQQMAYLVDAYRGETKEYRLVDYTLFVTFFPQLIAGPIVHHKEMLPQFMRRGAGAIKARDVSIGMTIFFAGLFKKVVFADTLSGFATPVFQAADGGWAPQFTDAWIATLAYTLQLYFDFSGYSDMAIGLGRLFGIRLPLNFHSPYKAVNVIDFWRRWHMTLSRFLRDYLYIPLGGNRKGPGRRYVNLMATMVLGGMWHGAGWTFVFWGFLHGVYLCANHLWAAARERMGWGASRGLAGRALSIGATFLAVMVAWVLLRAATFGGAGRILAGMAGMNPWEPLHIAPLASVLWILPLLLVVWFLPNTQQWMARWKPALESSPRLKHWTAREGTWLPLRWSPSAAWSLGAAAVGVYAVLQMAGATEFIYFQF